MDSLTYNYYTGNNRLKFVRDSVPDNIYTAANANTEDINNQTVTTNYTYDRIGNLLTDAKDSVKLIIWNVYGKIVTIQRSASAEKPITLVQYTYDPAGNRLSKKISRNTDNIVEYTSYVRDASGNIMATYFSSGCFSNSPLNSNYTLQLREQNMYGSSRIGLVNRDLNMKVTKEYAMLILYQFAENSPIFFIDLDGLEGLPRSLRENKSRGNLYSLLVLGNLPTASKVDYGGHAWWSDQTISTFVHNTAVSAWNDIASTWYNGIGSENRN